MNAGFALREKLARVVMFTGTAERALRRYIEIELVAMSLDQKPPQRIRPHDLKRAMGIATGRYTTSEGDMSSKNGFVAARERFKLQAAVNHFTEMAKHDRCSTGRLRPLSGTTIQKSIQKIGLRAGIKINPYSFRHSFRHSSPGQRGDLRVIQELLGHTSNPSTQKS